MTDRDALLRAICENPDDDAPRLIYADWLDEHGDARQAEFIRVQIELARVPERNRQDHPLAAREQTLWRELRKWRFAPSEWTNLGLGDFVRGFNAQWRGDATRFVEVANDWWRLGPVENLRLFVNRVEDSGTAAAEAVAKQPALATVRRVEVYGNRLSDRWVERFFSTEYYARWHQLTLSGNRMTDAVCHWLAAHPLASSNCAVVLESLGISDSGRRALERAYGPRQTVGRIA